MRNRLYIDLDGTVARFHDEPHYLTRMYDKGFFENLLPFENVIEGIKYFIDNNPGTEVSVLTSLINGFYCQKEKLLWVKHYLPEIGSVIFVPEGMDKADFIPMLTKSDVLLDDYNHNLRKWENAGGKAVKLVNNINHLGKVGRKWAGDILYYENEPMIIAEKLKSAFYNRQISFFDVPYTVKTV